MWISEAFRQPPRGGWAMTIAAWLRTICLALAVVMMGAGLDASIESSWSSPAWPTWVMAVCLIVIAASAGAVAEGLPGIVQAREERSWRARVMTAFLVDELQLPDELRDAAADHSDAGHPETGKPASAADVSTSAVRPTDQAQRPGDVNPARHKAGHPQDHRGGLLGSHPDGRPGGHPGVHPGGHSGAHPGGHSGAHPGGHPGKGVTSVDGLLLDAATEGVEKTAFYRAVFLSPTLASFSSPILILVIWIALLDPISGLLLVPFVALVPLLISTVGKRLRRSTNEYRRKQAQAAGSYLEMIDGLGTLTVLGAIDRAREQFARSARDVAATITKLLVRNQATIVVNDLVFGLIMTGAAISLILWRLADAAMTTGQAFAALLLTVLLAEPIDRLGRNFYVGLGGRARRDGLAELLPTQSSQLPAASPLAKAVAPSLALRDVSVVKAGKRILSDVDLDIPAGTHLALVGPTGAGKTTLLRVLAGLDTSNGTVLVDGSPSSATQRREMTSMLAQRAGMLSTTIADNLQLAAPEASETELAEACRAAQLDLAIFPAGLETEVGEQGALLSGGQRRRVALARTMLRDRPLLILDEPTADLDRRTEALVRQSVDELSRGRTVVHVAHRLSMIAGADLVAVMRDGQIVDVGTPAELAQRPGFVRDSLAAEGGKP